MLVIAIFLLVFAAVPTIFAIQGWRTWYYLWREGITVPAEIRHTWKAQLGLMPLYYVIYEYEGEDAEGNPFFFNRHAEIEMAQYRAMQEGESLHVTYAASRPALARLEGQPSMRWRLTIGSICSWLYFFFMLAIMT